MLGLFFPAKANKPKEKRIKNSKNLFFIKMVLNNTQRYFKIFQMYNCFMKYSGNIKMKFNF